MASAYLKDPAMSSYYVVRFVSCAALLLTPISALALAAITCTTPAINPSTPDSRFTINNDGTTTDNTTGLTWMRCSLGQTWDGSSCTGSAASYSWQQALQAVLAINDGTSNADNDGAPGFADYTHWRLPNIAEASSIVEYCRVDSASGSINETVFPNTSTAGIWSSSPLTYAPSYDGYRANA